MNAGIQEETITKFCLENKIIPPKVKFQGVKRNHDFCITRKWACAKDVIIGLIF